MKEKRTDSEMGESKKLSFKEKFFRFLDKSVESSKKAFYKAGEKISDFSDKSVLKIEVSRLNGKLEKLYARLGEFVFEKHISAKPSAADLSALNSYYMQIEELLSEIEAKKSAAGAAEGESAAVNPESSAVTVVDEKQNERIKQLKTKTAKASARSASVKTAQKKSVSGKSPASRKTSSVSSSEKSGSVRSSVKKTGTRSSAAVSSKTKKTSGSTGKTAAVKSSSRKISG